MNKNRILWVMLGLLLVAAVAVFIINQDGKYKWWERYEVRGKQPYDLKLLYTLLQKSTTGHDFEVMKKPMNETRAKLNKAKKYNWVMVKNYLNLDTAETYALVNFLEDGNNVFIAANYINPMLGLALEHGVDSLSEWYIHATSTNEYVLDLPDSVYNAMELADWEDRDSIFRNYQNNLRTRLFQKQLTDSVEFGYQTILNSVKTKQQVTMHYAIRDTFVEHQWHSINLHEAQIVHNTITKAEHPAFVEVSVGRGKLYISSTPLLYTNYFLNQDDFFRMAGEQFAHLPPANILFDEVKRFNNNFPGNTPKSDLSKSPLSFILSQPALAWAWYLVLVGVLLFVIFGAKRKQRIIPITKPNLNTTLAYAKTLGSLQLREKNNTAKGTEILAHFIQHLRHRNRWHSNELSDELKNKLLKLAPDLKKEIEIVLYLGIKCQKKQPIEDHNLINMYNYTQRIIARI
jgi:hypothetical protein